MIWDALPQSETHNSLGPGLIKSDEWFTEQGSIEIEGKPSPEKSGLGPSVSFPGATEALSSPRMAECGYSTYLLCTNCVSHSTDLGKGVRI